MHFAAMRGNHSVLQALLDLGAEINSANATGNNALQLAVKEGFQKASNLLLRNNADISHANLLGHNASDIAENENHKKISALIKTYTESQPGFLDRLLPE